MLDEVRLSLVFNGRVDNVQELSQFTVGHSVDNLGVDCCSIYQLCAVAVWSCFDQDAFLLLPHTSRCIAATLNTPFILPCKRASPVHSRLSPFAVEDAVDKRGLTRCGPPTAAPAQMRSFFVQLFHEPVCSAHLALSMGVQSVINFSNA